MFVVLDTETTGRSYAKGDRLVEVGAIKFDNRQRLSEYHKYINPMCSMSIGAFKVHGLSDNFLSDKEKFSDIAEGLYEYLKGTTLVIHNAPFDLGFLNHEFEECGFGKISDVCEVVDTLIMARKIYPGQRNSLDALCKRLGVDLSSRTKHGALLDANLLAEVYLIMTSKQHSMEISARKNKANASVKLSAKNFVKYPSEEEIAGHEEFIKKFSLNFDENNNF